MLYTTIGFLFSNKKERALSKKTYLPKTHILLYYSEKKGNYIA